ncbi:MAG: AAA family ATPase, partial [Ktedonobacterales bacterium]
PPGYVGYDQAGQLTEAVRRRPFSIVLFDEVEKAHPQVFDLLLQVLEDGQLSDAKGRVVDFKNTIVIMTTNVGAERLSRQGGAMGFARGKDGDENTEMRDYAHMRDVVMTEMQQAFRPEFLNRIDDIILFHTLTKREAREILGLMLAQTQARLSEQLVKLRVTDEAQDYLIERGFNYEYGARSLRRIVQALVEDRLAETLLLKHIHTGDLVFIERNPNNDGSDDSALTLRPMAALPARTDGSVADESQTA